MNNGQVTNKFQQLRAIAGAAQRCECRDIEPRTLAGLIAASLVVLFAWTIFELSIYNGLLLTATGFVSVYVSYPFPRSWKEILDCLVTAYEPVDIDSYTVMHKASDSLGGIDLQAIRVWLGKESNALNKVGTECR